MEAENGAITNYKSLLFSQNRDFLVRNNGDQVKALEGETIGVYFSSPKYWFESCQQFTPTLVEVYNEIKKSGGIFEVVMVFVSGDVEEDAEESFKEDFSCMPWLAVPFSDTASREMLCKAFGVYSTPHLCLIDGRSGAMMESDAEELVNEYGAEASPFSKERVAQLKEEEEDAKRNQTLTTVLTTVSRDYLLSSDGTQVRGSELEGKMVAIYFLASDDCKEFSLILSKMCSELKGRGEPFEVVLAFLDWEEDEYKMQTWEMPWLALPFKDSSIRKLIRYFKVKASQTPRLVLLGADGKTINENLEEVVEDHGASAYPFSSERIAELAELERKRMDEQTLESLLVFDDLDYVLGKEAAKVPVKDLVGKTVLIYFSAHGCGPCRYFTPKLAMAYKELKMKQCEVEVIFVSSDHDQCYFDEHYSSMPWLALPYGDTRKSFLSRKFDVQGIPTLVAIDASGRTITRDGRDLVEKFGAEAFPFTEEHIVKLEKKEEEEEEESGDEGDMEEEEGQAYIDNATAGTLISQETLTWNRKRRVSARD